MALMEIGIHSQSFQDSEDLVFHQWLIEMGWQFAYGDYRKGIEATVMHAGLV